MPDIDIYLAETLQARAKGIAKPANWYARLKSFFDRQFGPDWRKTDPDFWKPLIVTMSSPKKNWSKSFSPLILEAI